MRPVKRSLILFLVLHLTAGGVLRVHAEEEKPSVETQEENEGEIDTDPSKETPAPSAEPSPEVSPEPTPEPSAEPSAEPSPVPSEEPEPQIIPVDNISADVKWLILNVEEEAQLNVTVEPENATDPSLTFVSENPKVVSVDEKGNLTGLKKGKTAVVVKDAEKKHTLRIRVAVKNEEDETYELMYRLYNPNSGEHFYTSKKKERDFLKESGWSYEGLGWTAPLISSEPVYRLYNSFVGDHHYTLSYKERTALEKLGWTYEGIGWYSDEEKTVPLYRQYNPNEETGTHNYTTSKKENDALTEYGWKAEGIGWYGVKNPVFMNYHRDNAYYQVDPATGEIIHVQKLFDPRIRWAGIDISYHNGDIDLKKYQSGFVILRLSYSWKEDKKAQRNMDLCEKLKIPYGVYIYSYALNPSEAIKEADFALKLLKGRDIRLGVWFDMEDADFYKIKRNHNFYNKKTISSICQAFCSRVQKAGYHTGIYASYSWFRDLIEGCDAYDKWVAHWGTNNGKLQDKAYEYAVSIGASIHQYSAVDLDKNVMYVDPMTFAD